ncbi:MFS transporter, partial [Streptomyces sp. SID6013]|nr:MFS transporter [Streptomyces sp. SID6013]
AFIAGPLLSRWADTYGRRRVLLVTGVLNSGALTAIVLAPPRPVLLACLSLLSGLTTPPIAAAVRAVLPELVDKDRRRSVFALESTLQELVFVLGPPVTALLTAFAGARFAVIVCAALVLLGVLGYARDPKAEIGRNAGFRVNRRPVLGVPGISRLVVAGALLFAALGCQAIGVIAMVSGSGVSSNAGFVVACGSLGSLVGGLVYGSLTRHRAGLRHLLFLFTAGFLLLLLTGRPIVLAFLVFLWGLTIAPAMSRLLERLSTLAPPESTTEVFGWTNSATAGGNALATAVSGFVVTAYGARASLVTGCALGLIAAMICEPAQARPPPALATPPRIL